MPSSSARSIFFTTVEVLLHASFLLVPFWFSGVLHSSDSMMHQVPDVVDPANNITTVGFGIRKFSVNGTEDVSFSDEQQDTLGDQHTAAHVTYHVFWGVMIVALCIPLIKAMICRWWCNKMEGRTVLACMTRSIAKRTIPIMILFTILMAAPFILLTRSNLCGPNYIELRYDLEVDASSDSGEDEWDHHGCDDYVGTLAIVHEGVGATCELGTSGVGTAVMLCLWPFFMVAQAFFLNSKAKKMEAAIENVIVVAPVIEVYDMDNKDATKEDDATVESRKDGAELA
jgi:hypothetical protein